MYENHTGINSNKREGRKHLVLGHVVHEYVSTAAPVSSRVVAGKMDGRVSSATVRNIMAELEKEGYITHPHTSAGRIPTQLGYRCYVDAVKEKIRLRKEEARRLSAEYSRRIRTMKEVIEKTSFLISRELHNAGIVMWPSIEDAHLKHMELVKVRAETILAVLVTMTNAVKNHIIRLDQDIEKPELEHISNYINANYERSPISFIHKDLNRVLNDGAGEGGKEVLGIARTSLKIIDTIIEENIENEIYWEGLNYFMERAEFQDIDITRRILQIFSERKVLIDMMKTDLSCHGLKIYIGSENRSEVLTRCSVVTCGYTLHGRTAGRIGVIGPTRMDYDSAIRTVSCLSDLVSAKLEEIND